MPDVFRVGDLALGTSSPCLAELDPWSSTRDCSAYRNLSVAILLSLLAHLVLAQWRPLEGEAPPISSLAKSIQIRLALVAPTQGSSLHEDVLSPTTSDDTQESKILDSTRVAKTLMTSDADTNAGKSKSAGELESRKTASNRFQKNPDIDTPVPSASNAAPAELATSTAERDDHSDRHTDAFSDVFDSRLRERLQTQSSRSANTSAAHPEYFVDAHRDAIVAVGDGRCFRVAPASQGTTESWYWAACPGVKSESDNMKDRIREGMKRHH